MRKSKVNFRHATPIDLIGWIEREFDSGISNLTKQRLANFGVNRSTDLESFLISIEPQELIWILHPIDVLSFVLDCFLQQINTGMDAIESLRITRSSDWLAKEVTLIPLNSLDERVEVGDLLKSKLVRLWKTHLDEYSRSPHSLLAEMESLCLEIEQLQRATHISEKIARALDDLFLRLSKAYEQQIRALMYFCRAVMVQLFRDTEPVKPSDSAYDSWTLRAMERYISRDFTEWIKSNADSRQSEKIIGAIDKIFGSGTGTEYPELPQRLRQYRNISVHDYLDETGQKEYLDRMLSFIKNAKEARLVTGYITSVSTAPEATRVVMRLDGTSQTVNLMYRDLTLYTPFKSQWMLKNAIYKTRVMAFPLSPDERRVFQPFLVKHGVFDKEGYCKNRSALCYEDLEVEFSCVKDVTSFKMPQEEAELTVED